MPRVFTPCGFLSYACFLPAFTLPFSHNAWTLLQLRDSQRLPAMFTAPWIFAGMLATTIYASVITEWLDTCTPSTQQHNNTTNAGLLNTWIAPYFAAHSLFLTNCTHESRMLTAMTQNLATNKRTNERRNGATLRTATQRNATQRRNAQTFGLDCHFSRGGSQLTAITEKHWYSNGKN